MNNLKLSRVSFSQKNGTISLAVICTARLCLSGFLAYRLNAITLGYRRHVRTS